MPFLMRDAEGRKLLFYCVYDSCWRLHYTVEDGEPVRLETGFPPGTTECSPTAWIDESGYHISFIAGTVDTTYRLYRMDGSDLQNLSQPVSIRVAKTGFVYKDRLVVGEFQDVVHVHDTDGDRKIEIPGAFLYRISYRSDEAEKLLISGDWIGETGDVFCIEYDLQTDNQRFLECGGVPAYKCSILGDEILFAQRTGKHFEDRRIKRGKSLDGVKCRTARRIEGSLTKQAFQRTKSCGCRLNSHEKKESEPSVRPSCLECVEKHLGAAAVILSEIHNCYEYRLRFVGHLHEAEEESQDFLPLHEMIRDARKAYQRENIVPDWESLAREVEHAR